MSPVLAAAVRNIRNAVGAANLRLISYSTGSPATNIDQGESGFFPNKILFDIILLKIDTTVAVYSQQKSNSLLFFFPICHLLSR